MDFKLKNDPLLNSEGATSANSRSLATDIWFKFSNLDDKIMIILI
jgi:hypothetical protein